MSDLSVLSHGYAATSSFAKDVNALVLTVKKAHLRSKGAALLSAEEIAEARGKLASYLDELRSELDPSSPGPHERASLPPDFVERLHEREKNRMAHFLEDLGEEAFCCDRNKAGVHPADHARARAIEAALRLQGFEAEVSSVRAWWERSIEVAGQSEPADFGLYYPPALIDEIACLVEKHCEQIGMLPYARCESSPDDVSVAVPANSAWDTFRADPQGFPDWQKRHMALLRAQLESE